MTGTDLSGHLLERARIAGAGCAIRWVEGDMREVPFSEEFDAVLNVFSSFGYFDSAEEDLEVLRQALKALRPGGQLVLELLNREAVIRGGPLRIIHRHPDGLIALHEGSFDLRTSRLRVRVTMLESDGARKEYAYSVRQYTLTELIALLERAGLRLEACFGGSTGPR